MNSGPRISIAEKNATYFLAQTNFFVLTVQRYIQTSQAKREFQPVFRQEYHFKVLLIRQMQTAEAVSIVE